VKFWSRYVNWRVTVEPDDFEYHAHGKRTKIHGLHAQFENNQFDTEAQGWDDETRERVERALMDAREYGDTLRMVSDDEMETAIAAAQPKPANCLFTRTIDGQAWICGAPAISEDGYCEQHASEMDAPRVRPNRRKEPAA
jgi:hypothetical protein